MIPQTFDNNNQTITINFTVGGTPHTLSYALNGTSWGQGQCITYTITTEGLVWEYVLEATGGETAYTGGNTTFNVKSYRYKRTSPSVVEPVAWTIDGYKASGASDFSSTKPTWLSSITTSGIGTSTTSATNTGTATLAAQTSTTGAASFTDIERGTSSAPYDLSTKGGTTSRNTANCYVVNAPGWYKIPLVYGNGIKNGSANTSAYNSSTFIDYNGTQIRNLTGPYLKYSGTIGTTGGGAPSIIWQDVQGMVTNLSVAETTTENGYLKFYIASNKIAEGNAVIAVKNSSGITMWSWHIWVTATEISQTITITGYDTSYSYQLMPVNLGWVSLLTSTSYAGRGVRIKIKQDNSNNTATECIMQRPYKTPSRLGNNTFYQWGRKDPFPGGKYDENAQKSAWDNSGTAFSVTPTSTQIPYNTSIQNPGTIYGQTTSTKQGWCTSASFIDAWNAGTTTTSYTYDPVVKSIYDPNPYGFKMPPSNAYTGILTVYEINCNDLSKVKGTYNSDEATGLGWDFYTSPSNQHFFIPLTGQIRHQEYLTYHNGSCIWNAYANSESSAVYFYCGRNTSVGPRHSLETEACHSVRPIAE